MSIEFELKFRATPEKLDAIRCAIDGTENRISMETTYYDTPADALSQRHYTLRLRQENQRAVCTLKAPAEPLGRAEFEIECGDIFAALPELCKLSGQEELLSLTNGGLIPVCSARFTRITKILHPEGCTVELALDHGVLLGGGKELPLCEVEVELKAGDRRAAWVYAMALADAYGLEQEKHSKFRRALALAKGDHI